MSKDKLLGDKLRAEGYKLVAKGDELVAKGHRLVAKGYNKVHHGNCNRLVTIRHEAGASSPWRGSYQYH